MVFVPFLLFWELSNRSTHSNVFLRTRYWSCDSICFIFIYNFNMKEIRHCTMNVPASCASLMKSCMQIPSHSAYSQISHAHACFWYVHSDSSSLHTQLCISHYCWRNPLSHHSYCILSLFLLAFQNMLVVASFLCVFFTTFCTFIAYSASFQLMSLQVVLPSKGKATSITL